MQEQLSELMDQLYEHEYDFDCTPIKPNIDLLYNLKESDAQSINDVQTQYGKPFINYVFQIHGLQCVLKINDLYKDNLQLHKQIFDWGQDDDHLVICPGIDLETAFEMIDKIYGRKFHYIYTVGCYAEVSTLLDSCFEYDGMEELNNLLTQYNVTPQEFDFDELQRTDDY